MTKISYTPRRWFSTCIWIFVVVLTSHSIVHSFRGSPCPMDCECSDTKPSLTELLIDCKSRLPNRLDGNFSSEIDDALFNFSSSHDLDNLTSVTIINSPLSDIPVSVCNLRSLTYLNLNNNRLRRLTDHCLVRMSGLVYLSAADNKISELQDGLFDGLSSLESITLFRNAISSIGSRVFSNSSNLMSLRTVALQYNLLTTLDTWPILLGVAAGTKQRPVHVSLAGNRISNSTNTAGLPVGCGWRVRSYLVLDLDDNRITYLKDMVNGIGISSFIELRCLLFQNIVVSIYKNKLMCDCIDFEYFRFAMSAPSYPVFNRIYCENKSFLTQRKLVRSVDLNDLVCDVSERCPVGCHCVYRPANSTMHIYCSGSNLTSMPTALPLLPKHKDRYKIELAYNPCLSELSERDYFARTTVLDVSNSALERINPEAWTQIVTSDSMQEVLLNGNCLKTLPREQVTTVNISSQLIVHLDSNPWSCSCDDSWMNLWLTSISKQLTNEDGILCDLPDRLRGQNIIQIQAEEFCVDPAIALVSKVLPSTIAGVATLLLVVLIVVYRWRIKLFVRWKIHPFDRDDCAGEDMVYDVFLCCSWEDHNPHAIRIVERLEHNGFSVCYHERDFAPGELISENIGRAIVRSKRTVCLVSTNFINSAYCMHEFESAYHHYITVVRKKRLVLLMMLDSPSTAINEVDDNSLGSESLRQYLRQYTYIDYTADDWFDRLLYALPLNGLLQQQQPQPADVDDESLAMI